MSKNADKASSRSAQGPVSIAPMMGYTDRHYRFFMRQITRRTLLYTEMITTSAVLYGKKQSLLDFSDIEKPLALQLGGDDPKALAQCCTIAQDVGFDEVNLNVGCPSDRVQNGNFGACLMATPEVVASAIERMISSTDMAVTVKTRIGIDDLDRYEDLCHFVDIVSQSGCNRFIIHARKAHLKGLSPKENRTIPPLRYPDVYRLKADFPNLLIEINGGVKCLDEVESHLEHVDGVMVGRSAFDHPYMFSEVDARFYGRSRPVITRREIIEAMVPYVEDCLKAGIKAHCVLRAMQGLFFGQPYGRIWRRYIGACATNSDKPKGIFRSWLKAMTEEMETAPEIKALPQKLSKAAQY